MFYSGQSTIKQTLRTRTCASNELLLLRMTTTNEEKWERIIWRIIYATQHFYRDYNYILNNTMCEHQNT